MTRFELVLCLNYYMLFHPCLTQVPNENSTIVTPWTFNNTTQISDNMDRRKKNTTATSSSVPILAKANTTIFKPKIRVLALAPQIDSDEDLFRSAIELAQHFINKDDSILKNYELDVEVAESTSQIGFAYKTYYDNLEKPPLIQALIGPAYSEMSKAIAKLATLYNMPQISYGALINFEAQEISKYSNEQKKQNRSLRAYPFYMTTTVADKSFFDAKIKLFQYFGWEKVAIIYEVQSMELFSAANSFASLLQKSKIQVLSIQGVYDLFVDARVPLNEIEKVDARIIVVFLGALGARKVFCEAYKRNLFGPKYQWIVFAGIPNNWWMSSGLQQKEDEDGCTSSNYLNMTNGYITFSKSPVRSDGVPTIANKTAPEIWNMIQRRHGKPTTLNSFGRDATFAFDATYVTALALDKTLRHHEPRTCDIINRTRRDLKTQLEACYKEENQKSLNLIKAMLDVEFEGVTGHVSYDETENRIGEVLIRQFFVTENFTKGEFKEKGYYNGFTKKITFLDKDGKTFFQDGKVTKDGIETIYTPKRYSTTLVSILFFIAGAGVLLSISMFVFNVTYRDVRLIKMSSPNINNGIIAGCIISYISVFLYGLDSRWIDSSKINYACNGVVITLSVGFTLSFGCLFSKTWRIYKVFIAAKTMERVAIKDFHLYGVILVLITIDIVVFILWITISPFNVVMHELESSINKGVKEVFFYYKCSSDNQLPFTVTLYVYKGLLMIFGIFLAWETRGVKIAVLNDSKYIGMAIYNVCVVAGIGVVCATALYNTDYFSSGFLLVTLTVFICTTGTLLLIFVPKIYLLFGKTYDRTHGGIFSQSTRSVSTTSQDMRSSSIIKSPMTANRYSIDSQMNSSFENHNLSSDAHENGISLAKPGILSVIKSAGSSPSSNGNHEIGT